MAAERTVMVSSIPADLTGDKIEIHFGKKSTGGGDIEKVDFQAKVTFYSAEVAARVVNRSHRLGKQSVPVKVFASVAALVTPAEVPDLAECPEEIMAALSAQTGVSWVREPGGYRLQGIWGQVENARIQGTWGQVENARWVQTTGHLGTGGERTVGTGYRAPGDGWKTHGGYRLQGTWGHVFDIKGECLLQRRYCQDDETMDEAVESGQTCRNNGVGEEDRASSRDAMSTEAKVAWGEVEQQNSMVVPNTKRDHAVGIWSEDPNSAATTKEKVLPVDVTPEVDAEEAVKVLTTATQKSTRANVVLEDSLTSDESSEDGMGDKRGTCWVSHPTAAKRESLPDSSADASVAVIENKASAESASEITKTTRQPSVLTAQDHQLNRDDSSEESDDAMRPVTKSSAKHVTVDSDIMAYIVHMHKDKLAAIQDNFKVMIKMDNSTDRIGIKPNEQCSRRDLEEAYETFVSLYQEMFKSLRPHRANLAEVHIPIESIRFVLDMIKREHDKVFITLNDKEKIVLFCGEDDMVRKARAKFYEVLSIPDPAHRRSRRPSQTTDAFTAPANDATTNKGDNNGPQAYRAAVADSLGVGFDTKNIGFERRNVSKWEKIAQSHSGFEADSTGSGDVPEVTEGGTSNGGARPTGVRSKLSAQGNSPIDSIQPITASASCSDLSADGVKAGRSGGTADKEGPPGEIKTCHMSRGRLEFMTRTGVKVFIYQGDITQEVADVIVSCNNESLDSAGGIARAISDAGGPEIRRACVDYIRRHGRLSAGQSIWTPGGRLRCQHVVHTVSPQSSRDQTDHQQLFSTFLDLLNIAEFDLKVNSIAIPAIGSGIAGFPKAVCADVMFRVISAFEDYQTPDSLLKEIRLVNIDAKTTAAFVQVFSQHLADSGVLTALVGQGAGSSSVSGAGDKDANLYVFTGGKGKEGRGGKTGSATQRGAHARSRDYGGSKPNYVRVGNVACNFNTEENTQSHRGHVRNLAATAADFSDDSSDEIEEDEKCPVCLGRVGDPRTLACRHTFCSSCIDMSIKSKPECPVCKMPLGNRRGNQPDGSMAHRVDQSVRLPGYERYGTIVIDYHIPGGTQGVHAHNIQLSGEFEGTSVMSGQPNTIVWNDIHHKTNIHGGPTK
uniref:RING-type E3 ubiquitin transferase n=1 Tax=Branchiostoma floridae TaxID=7739 RepID=C3Y5Q2_BRAFL|eukprot:XP_002608289.1 hypothetical protein BRAFLDRAFT_87969 [Branchiostoma floridae]